MKYMYSIFSKYYHYQMILPMKKGDKNNKQNEMKIPAARILISIVPASTVQKSRQWGSVDEWKDSFRTTCFFIRTRTLTPTTNHPNFLSTQSPCVARNSKPSTERTLQVMFLAGTAEPSKK